MTAPDPAALLAAMEAAARQARGDSDGAWFLSDRVTKSGLSLVEDGLDFGIFPIRAERKQAAFIATANPAAVLQLCATLRASQEREAAAVAALRHIAKAWPGTPAAVHACAALIREDAAP